MKLWKDPVDAWNALKLLTKGAAYFLNATPVGVAATASTDLSDPPNVTQTKTMPKEHLMTAIAIAVALKGGRPVKIGSVEDGQVTIWIGPKGGSR